jgi:methyltransferase (TIGR00027 family)
MRAGRTSVTARWVASHRARLAPSRPSTPSGDVHAEQALARQVRGIFGVPLGGPTGMAPRTAFIDNEVAGALGRGVGQVVVLGAGYDGRALRFAGAATRWWEVDLPGTQHDKRRRLAALGVTTDKVTFVPLDLLRGDLGAALEAEGHDATAPSLYLCEGLFGHLSLEVVAALCGTLRASAPAGSVLVSTYLVLPEVQGHRGPVVRGVKDRLLRVIGEQRRSEFFPGDAEKLMVVTGWRPTRSQRSPGSWLGQGAHLLTLAAEPAPEPGSAPS